MAEHSTVIVGAGMVGLATAWHLQERGVEVTILDRHDVAAGSSSGNAGWLSPALTLPLNDPATMSAGVRAVLKSNSPVYVPPTLSPRLMRFLTSFARHSTPVEWKRSLTSLVALSRDALGAYDQLAIGNPDLATNAALPLTAAFTNEAARTALTHEFDELANAGEKVEYRLLNESDLRTSAPHLGNMLTFGVAVEGQRFIDAGKYVRALAEVVKARGGIIVPGTDVARVESGGSDATVHLSSGQTFSASSVVLANGAWLPQLARGFGMKVPIQAGRGYSFSVPRPDTVTGPLYLPEARVAFTPLANGRLRVAGMMEFRSPDAALDRRRIKAIQNAVMEMLPAIDWQAKTDEWVGARPCTPDGLPVLGRTKDPRVFVAGGHGMWGIALGPLSGRLVAEIVVGARDPSTISDFDPLR